VELMTMKTTTHMSRSAVALITGVIAAGIAAVASRLPELSTWSTADLMAMVGIVAATVLGESIAVKVRFGAETKNISVTESAYAAALLFGVRPGVLVIAAALGVAVAYTARGTAGHKVAFNAGSFAVAATVAQVVFASVQPVSPLLAAALAMGAFFVVNATTVVGAIALITGKTFADVMRPIARVEATHAVGNLLLGAMAVGVWTAAPVAIPAMIVLPVLALAAYEALSPQRRLLPRT
jgi:hypothetical protein